MSAAQALFQLGSKALNPSNPYSGRTRQAAFTSYGIPHCFGLLNRVACLALQIAWYQKWQIYWRIRPEEYFGLLQVSKGDEFICTRSYDFFVGSVERLKAKFGVYLLPQSYPEGCPMHPAFPAGHAMIAGACGVILKYLFNGNFQIPAPKQVSKDSKLVAYPGVLTIDDEIDKLVWNVSFGRSFAGVHWRSDCIHGIRLGEQVASELLSEICSIPSRTECGSLLQEFFSTGCRG